MSNTFPRPLPTDVLTVTDRYQQLLDGVLPGTLEGLYLVGSIALGDYHPGKSDIDFVAITSVPLAPADLDRVEQVHSALQKSAGTPWFDGIYVTWNDLARNPLEITQLPFTLEGTFQRTGGFEANPSTWLTVRQYAIPVRGPTHPDVWYDLPTIRRWNVDNLNSYWHGVAEQVANASPTALADTGRLDTITEWCVCGATRLHYTIVTGNITSKSGACRYALSRFPQQWHQLIGEALAIRSRAEGSSRSPETRRNDIRDFLRFVIADANHMLSA